MEKQKKDYGFNRNEKPWKGKSLGKAKSLMQDRYYSHIVKKNPKFKGVTDTEYRKMMEAFWDKVGEVLIGQPNGVVLDGLGYFAFPSYIKKMRSPVTKKINVKTKGFVYYPQFFGKLFNNFHVSGLSLELARKFRRRWYHLVEAGQPYKFHYSTLKQLVGGKRKYAYKIK